MEVLVEFDQERGGPIVHDLGTDGGDIAKGKGCELAKALQGADATGEF